MAAESFGVNGAFLRIEVKGKSTSVSIDLQNFERYIEVENYALPGKPNIGISLPNAELAFTSSDVPAVTKLLSEKEILVEVAVSASKDRLYNIKKFRATNFDIQFIEGTVQMTMFLIRDLSDFITKTQQASYKDKTLLEVIKEISSIPADIDDKLTATDDKMTWLQFGVSDYQFLSQSVKHAKLKDETDLLLTAINNNTLKVSTYNNIIKKPNSDKVFMSAAPNPNKVSGYKNTLACSSVNIETAIGVYQYMLSVQSIPVLKILNDETDANSGAFSRFFSGGSKVVNPFTSDRVQAPKLDCGNIFDGYWETQLANEKKIANIYRNLIYLDCQSQLAEGLSLLDPVEYSTGTEATLGKETPSVLDGTYCVFGISRYIGKQTVATRVTIAKSEY